MPKKSYKKGGGFFSSIKSTVTSMNLTCRQIWEKYSSQLDALVKEIDAFYQANDMKTVLLTLYKTEYDKSYILNGFESVKGEYEELVGFMTGAKKTYYNTDPNGKLCGEFIHTDYEGKKAATTFDQYLQGLVKRLVKIRDTMITIDVSSFKNASTSYIPLQSAGRRSRHEKKHITIKGIKRHYVVRKDDSRHKYIQKDGKKVYLSEMKGRYTYV